MLIVLASFAFAAEIKEDAATMTETSPPFSDKCLGYRIYNHHDEEVTLNSITYEKTDQLDTAVLLYDNGTWIGNFDYSGTNATFTSNNSLSPKTYYRICSYTSASHTIRQTGTASYPYNNTYIDFIAGCDGDGFACDSIYGGSAFSIIYVNVTPLAPKLEITATDLINSTTISNITAWIKNSTDTYYIPSENGTIYTDFLLNYSSELVNITIGGNNSNGGYFNRTYENYNISEINADIATELHQVVINVSAWDLSGSNIEGFNITYQWGTFSTLLSWMFINTTIGQHTFNAETEGYVPINAQTTPSLSALGSYNANLTFTQNSLNVTAINAINGSFLDVFNITVDNGTYNESFSTTTSQIVVPLFNGSYNITINSEFHSPNTSLVVINKTYTNHTFYLYTTNSVNITFYNELTNQVMNGINVTIDFISDIYSTWYNTTTGKLYVDLLSPASYTFRYKANNYSERFYYFTLNNNTNVDLSLYLLQFNQNVSDVQIANVTITILDDISNPVEGAYVKAMKYDLTTNAYVLKSMGLTDIDGKTYMDLVLNSEYYKFIIDYNSETIKTTEPSYIHTNAVTIIVNLDDATAQDFEYFAGISYQFNYSNNAFRLLYNDPNGVTTQGCVEVDRLFVSTESPANNSCVSGATGVFFVNVENITGATYRGNAYITLNGQKEFLGSIIYTYKEENVAGNLGLFSILLLTIVFACVGYWSLEFGMILTPIPLLIGHFLNIITLPAGATIIPVLIIVACIISVVVSRR